jgi:hypothetical protein
VRHAAQREIEAARQRIRAMRAEQAELGWLRRSRRAALDEEIARQEEAVLRWCAQADTVAIAPVTDRLDAAPSREAAAADRGLTRLAVVERCATMTQTLGDVPSGFAARERWMRHAASVVATTAPRLDPPTATPDIDDLGMPSRG